MSDVALLDEVIERGNTGTDARVTDADAPEPERASKAADDQESDSDEWTSCSSETDEHDDTDSSAETDGVRPTTAEGIDDTASNNGDGKLGGPVLELNGGWPIHGAEAKRRDNPKYTGTGGRLDFFAMYRGDVHLRNCGLESPRSLHLAECDP